MLKASFVDPDSFLVDGTKPEQTTLDSLQGKSFTFDTKSKKLDFTLAGKPEMTVSLVKKKMFIEVYEQK